MAFDLRLSVPVKASDSDGQGPRDGFLVSSLIRNNQAVLYNDTEKLVQQVYLEIINDPLPDGTGSGLASQLLQGPPNENQLAAIAAAGIDVVRRNILSYQTGVNNLSSAELLRGLRILSFTYTGTSFELKLELTTDNGVVVVSSVTV